MNSFAVVTLVMTFFISQIRYEHSSRKNSVHSTNSLVDNDNYNYPYYTDYWSEYGSQGNGGKKYTEKQYIHIYA